MNKFLFLFLFLCLGLFSHQVNATTFSGTNLQSLAGYPLYYYDSTNQIPADAAGHVLVVTGGTNFNAGAYYVYNMQVNYDGTGNNLVQLNPLFGSPSSASTGEGSGGTWSVDYGITNGGGTSGTNLILYVSGYWYDPDSQLDTTVMQGSEVTITSGTNFTVPQSYTVYRTVPNYAGLYNLMQLQSKNGSVIPPANAFGGTWSITQPAPSLTVVTPVPSFTGPVKLLLIGDSITSMALPNNFGGDLAAVFPNASSVIIDNMSVSNSGTADWLPGQVNFTNAVATANQSGTTVINIMLGTNNVGGNISTSIANLQATTDGLFAQIPTLQYVVVQDIPSPINQGAIDYNTALANVGHGATLGTFGDYEIFSNNPELLIDGIHPNYAGQHYLNEEWLRTLATVIPSASTSTRFIISGPTTGTAQQASTNFTVSTLTGSQFTGSQTITISDGGNGGTFTPSVGSASSSSVTITPTASTTSFTFTYTPVSSGVKTLSFTNGQSWANPSAVTYTASPAPDITAPIISAVTSSSTETTTTITWTTNETASSTVNYGLTSSYGLASSSQALATSHSITLTGLTASTLYHYQVGGSDSSGNVSTSTDSTFTTLTTVVIPTPDENDSNESSGGKSRTRRHSSISTQPTNASASITPTTIAPSSAFTRNLTLNAVGEDVRQLQIYLNTHGYPVAPSGVGSTGLETTYFGALTKAALIKFQAANNIVPSVGYFGPITRQFLFTH